MFSGAQWRPDPHTRQYIWHVLLQCVWCVINFWVCALAKNHLTSRITPFLTSPKTPLRNCHHCTSIQKAYKPMCVRYFLWHHVYTRFVCAWCLYGVTEAVFSTASWHDMLVWSCTSNGRIRTTLRSTNWTPKHMQTHADTQTHFMHPKPPSPFPNHQPWAYARNEWNMRSGFPYHTKLEIVCVCVCMCTPFTRNATCLCDAVPCVCIFECVICFLCQCLLGSFLRVRVCVCVASFVSRNSVYDANCAAPALSLTLSHRLRARDASNLNLCWLL